MHFNWITGMKSLLLPILIILILSFQVRAAAIDDLEYEVVKRAGGWQNLQGGWGKRNNEIAVDYEDKPSADYVNKPSPDYSDLIRNYDDDTSKAELVGAKRSRPGNWNNLKNGGWGKREPGAWNNLRGLWGKRSSWGKLQGGWGRK